MKMLLPAFIRFEGRRIFGSFQNQILFILLLISSVYFVFSGIWEYRSMDRQRHDFQQFERNKIQLYIDYSQYGGYGFRVFFQPNPISVFFNNSSIIDSITSNIDTMEIINVQRSYKGKNLFSPAGFLRDFAGVIFYFGSLIMLTMGASVLVSRAHLRLLLSRYPFRRIFAYALLSRLLILNLTFLLLQLGVWLIPRLRHLRFNHSENAHFLLFTLFSLLFLNFFFLLGTAIAALARLRRPLFPFLFVVWFVLLFVLPEIERMRLTASAAAIPANDKVNIRKMQNMIELEKRVREALASDEETTAGNAADRRMRAFHFMSRSYEANLDWENDLNSRVRRVIDHHERASALFPTLYYPFLAGELSGGGYRGYLDFMHYIIRIQDDFMRFYMRKRYRSTDRTVQSFVTRDENIFRGRSHLPPSYARALGLLMILSILLLLVGARALAVVRRR